jgi:hypothetical protein
MPEKYLASRHAKSIDAFIALIRFVFIPIFICLVIEIYLAPTVYAPAFPSGH